MPYDKQKARSEYSQKLRDPRWQKIRLEVMQRDEFTCQCCYDTASTLNVHHTYYEAGAAPWEYPVESLLTLCETCHEYETANRSTAETFLLRVMRARGYFASQVEEFAKALDESRFLIEPQFSLLCWAITTKDALEALNEVYEAAVRRGWKERHSAEEPGSGDAK